MIYIQSVCREIDLCAVRKFSNAIKIDRNPIIRAIEEISSDSLKYLSHGLSWASLTTDNFVDRDKSGDLGSLRGARGPSINLRTSARDKEVDDLFKGPKQGARRQEQRCIMRRARKKRDIKGAPALRARRF